MTQPPDDLERRPDGSSSGDPDAPDNQPTIAWTPPESMGDTPLADTTPTWEAPASAPPASPIISASPSAPPDPAGWQQPGPAGPVVAWETPGPAGAAPGREGYVIAGMGARLVAYFIDAVLVTIVPAVLGALVVDYGDLFQQVIDASAQGAGARANFVFEVTPELILVSLIGFAIQFIYFVGFWTSGGKATPGMRGLRMQVVDAATGGTLSLTAATKRFLAMGSVFALLTVVPAMQAVAGILPFAVSLFLFFTAITNERRQGLHDKWAGSLVIRSTSSGDGATLVGCLLLIVLVVGVGIIASVAFFAALGPQLEDLMRQMENTI